MSIGEVGSDCACGGIEDPEFECAGSTASTTTGEVMGEVMGDDTWSADIRDASSAFARSSSSCFHSVAALSDSRVAISRSVSSSEAEVTTSGGVLDFRELLTGLGID
jgi:hypothetical protein